MLRGRSELPVNSSLLRPALAAAPSCAHLHCKGLGLGKLCGVLWQCQCTALQPQVFLDARAVTNNLVVERGLGFRQHHSNRRQQLCWSAHASIGQTKVVGVGLYNSSDATRTATAGCGQRKACRAMQPRGHTHDRCTTTAANLHASIPHVRPQIFDGITVYQTM